MSVSKRFAVVLAAGVLVAGAAGVAGASTASAAQPVTVNCATSSLQSAIDNAALGATLLVSGTCDGNFTISNDLTLQGQGTAILDGQQSGVTLTIFSGTVTVQGLKITNGGCCSGHIGAGIVNEGGTLTVRDAVISGNTGSNFLGGGGIVNAGALTVQSSTVSDNTGQPGSLGAGIFNAAGSTETVADSTIANNTGLNGGIAGDVKQLTVNDTTITGNTGGGISSFGLLGSGDVNVVVNDSAITGNTGGSGIGVAQGDLTVNHTTVSNNAATGVFIDGGNATLNNTTVTDNTASVGGGGIVVSTQFGPASVTLSHSTVSGNSPNNCAPVGSVAGCVG